MHFYEMLSKYYDDIFPFSENVANVIMSNTPEKGKILDIGSATGKYITHYNNSGFSAFGVEYCPLLIKSPENTIIGDMNHLSFKSGFNTISCTGNTLVHAKSLSDTMSIMQSIFNLLTNGGKAVIQILNYEKILKNKPASIPTIKTDNCTFERRYEYIGNIIKFNGTLTTKTETSESSVELYPLTPRELMNVSFFSGFREISFYGGFGGEAFDMDESFVLTAVMSK